MDDELIKRHNTVVQNDDTVIHIGDFTLAKSSIAETYVKKLKGKHIFLRGSHDYWLDSNAPVLWEKKLNGFYIVAFHYAMRTWPRSHYNSWQVHGHSHGQLQPIGKQVDVGVDVHDFYPVSLHHLQKIMEIRLDNPNLVKTS
jgi:calcineurin-like phosphoesterase family protein